MPTGDVVICDSQSHRMIVLDARKFAIKGRTDMQSRPWGLSGVDDSSVFVTLLNKPGLQFMNLYPKLEKGRVIQLSTRCWGVEVGNKKIYLTAKMARQGVMCLSLT